MLHLKKVGGSNASLFVIGYEVVGILVDNEGSEIDLFKSKNLNLRLPSTRFTEKPYQFSDGEIIKIDQDIVTTKNSIWKYLKISS